MSINRSSSLVLGVLALSVLATQSAHAQVSQPVLAPSASVAGLPGDIPTFSMPPVDMAALLAEDAVAGKAEPFRFGLELPVRFDVKEHGAVEALPDGGAVYRLRIASEGAHSIGLVFSSYHLPEGAALWVHAADGSETLGAFTAANNKDDGLFAIHPVADDAVVLEYLEPADAAFSGEVRVNQVVHDYHNAFGKGGGAGYLGSGSCNVDVNCSVGDDWQDEKRAVAMIISGGVICTGALVNNTANDGTQYFWSANHCGGMNNAVFRFNYERSGCSSGGAPTNQTVQGSVLIASNSNVDYRLLRITGAIPDSYDVYFMGWNRSSTNPSNTVGIHHPSGDVKKISFDDDPATKSGTDWRISQWDLGVTEGGSSGSPLFDGQGLFIGQLCCGQAACGFPFNDYYGRLDLAWGAVQNSLDPVGNNPVTQAGYDPDIPVGPSVWTNLGGGLAGLAGIPVLVGTGELTANSPVTLSLTNAWPLATTTLFIGLSQIDAPFKGGVFVPSPDIVISGMTLLANGSIDLAGIWPPGIPPDVSIYYQFWSTDPFSPQGLTGSNGLQGTTP